MKYHHRTIGHFVNLLAEMHKDNVALRFRSDRKTDKFTYKQIHVLAEKVAEYLIGKGMKKGDKIVICSPNRPEYVVAMMAAGLAGFVLVPIDINTNPAFIQIVIDETEPQCLINTKEVDEIFNDIKHAFTNQMYIEDLFKTTEAVNNEDFRKRDFFISDVDLYEIIYTSGTTSNPKGVVLTNKNITGNIRSLRERLTGKSNWNFLNILPLSHMFGQVLGCFYPLRFGCSITLIERTKPTLIQGSIKHEGVTFVVTVPELLTVMKDKIMKKVDEANKTKVFNKMLKIASRLPFRFRRIIFSSIYKNMGKNLSYFLSGGAHLPEEVEVFWESIGIKILQGYGLTETSPVVSASGMNERKTGSVGRVLSRQDIKIEEDGEILTCGENVFSGYFKKPELDDEIFVNGWFRTGDIGEIDKDGYLYIRGRKKNMLLTSSGINVYPEDIEEEAVKYGSIKSCVVFGENISDKKLSISLVVIPKNGDVIDLDNLKTELNKVLLPHQRIRNTYLWEGDDFPRTHTLKIKRNLVVENIMDK